MLDTNKLNEIGMNTDTINMMKKMNMNNYDIFNEIKIILTLYPENLITCLINDINEPLFQSILLRLKLQEKLKLDNNKLIDSFNSNIHPLIKYLLCENNIQLDDKNITYELEQSSPELKLSSELEQSSPELSDELEQLSPELKLSPELAKPELAQSSEEKESLNNDLTIVNNVLEYIDECIIEDNNNFLKLDDVYDDFVNDWIGTKKYDTIDINNFTKFFSEKYGKLKSKDKIKGWKNININED